MLTRKDIVSTSDSKCAEAHIIMVLTGLTWEELRKVEDYYGAALRHFVDAEILTREESYDNAVYLYGNSAECTLKTMIMIYFGENGREILKNRYKHDMKLLIQELLYFITNSSAMALLDPTLGLKLQAFALPKALFQEHPERRYAQNGKFAQEDAINCRQATRFLLDEMIKQSVDGYIP